MKNLVLLSIAITFFGCKESNNQEAKSIASITSEMYGITDDSADVELFTLKNVNGMEVTISNYGGTIVSWTAPDSAGTFEDVVLGMSDLKGYLSGVPYFGSIVGRYGNRIAKGKFSIDGEAFQVPVNNGKNALHGGIKGFDKVVWKASPIKGDEVGLKLNYISKDGEEGYPGKLDVEVVYTLQNDNSLRIDYQAITDKKTVINLTNHTYFNLSGNVKADILNHEIRLAASRFLPVDKGLIPTGELRSVVGTPFDFLKSTVIGKRINDTTNVQIALGGGYDHCWVFDDSSTTLKSVALVYEPISKRTLEVLTTEPAIQFYTGNFLDGKLTGKNSVIYHKRYGLCLETQHYPDSPNQPKFPSTLLQPNETYKSTTVYKFGIKK